MAAPSLNLSKFMSTISDTDLARPNLYSVVFSSLNNNSSNDGVLDFLDNEYVQQVIDIGKDILSSQSELFRKVTGAYSPTVVRGIFGNDYLDFLGQNYDVSKDIGMMVKSVNIPGINLDVTANRFLREAKHIVTGRSEDNVTMTFYLTPGHAERLYMEMWINMVFDQKTSQVSFPSKYERPIEIFTYNRQGVAETKTSLAKAYPVRIGPVQLDAESNNQVSTFEVEFTYSYSTKSAAGGDANDENIINQGKSIFSAAKNIKNIF